MDMYMGSTDAGRWVRGDEGGRRRPRRRPPRSDAPVPQPACPQQVSAALIGQCLPATVCGGCQQEQPHSATGPPPEPRGCGPRSTHRRWFLFPARGLCSHIGLGRLGTPEGYMDCRAMEAQLQAWQFGMAFILHCTKSPRGHVGHKRRSAPLCGVQPVDPSAATASDRSRLGRGAWPGE